VAGAIASEGVGERSGRVHRPARRSQLRQARGAGGRGL